MSVKHDWTVEERLELPFRVFTSRYQNGLLARRQSLAKVGITLGTPKFPLGYEKQHCKLLAPAPAIFNVPDEKFRNAFRSQMYRLGIDRVIGLLREFSETAGGLDVVLLCFEDLRKPGEGCHRRDLAEWIEDQCGLVIDEYPEEDTAHRRTSQRRQQGSRPASHSNPVDELTAASATSQARSAVEQGTLW